MEEDSPRIDRLHSAVLKGERARTALDELEEFRSKREAATLAVLKSVSTPDEAFVLALRYQAMQEFISSAKAAVTVGRDAAKKLMESE
jgi:hypothetical protein